MLQWFNLNEAPVVRLLPGVRALVAEAEGGRVVFHLPVDYLSWTAEVAEAARGIAADRPDAAGGLELWVLGDVSELCKAELEGLGWTVRTHVGTQLRETAPASGVTRPNGSRTCGFVLKPSAAWATIGRSPGPERVDIRRLCPGAHSAPGRGDLA